MTAAGNGWTEWRGPRDTLRVESGTPGRRVLITGGAGFVGANLADALMGLGHRVTILDNCSRAGVERNIGWLRTRHGRLLTLARGDVRDAAAVKRAVAGTDMVFHLAAQVAVTTSLVDPVADFEVNARGTLNVLEAIRSCAVPPAAIMTSTNKVYGALDDVPMVETGRRWQPLDAQVRQHGVSEQRPLDFRSPYGCSKGAADQYVLDYARSYGVSTAVFRMSCIYGPRQLGTEDQGWVAHFLISALEGQPICVFGDGKQVRDILFVGDLVEAFVLAMGNVQAIRGQVFNIGGGPANTVSLLELLDLVTGITGERPRVAYSDWRNGDQRYYVSDTRRVAELLGWQPRTSVSAGIERLYYWLVENRSTTGGALAVAASSGLLVGDQRS